MVPFTTDLVIFHITMTLVPSPRYSYEFHYAVEEEEDDGPNEPSNSGYSDIVKFFEDVLHEEDAVGLFGSAKYPGDDFTGCVEFTEGRANINFLSEFYISRSTFSSSSYHYC